MLQGKSTKTFAIEYVAERSMLGHIRQLIAVEYIELHGFKPDLRKPKYD
jgi:hypothetical protein